MQNDSHLPAERLCVNCRHFEPASNGIVAFSKCNFRAKVRNMVDGSMSRDPYAYIYCDTQRNMPWLASVIFSSCGKSGRYFQVKQK